MTPFQEKKTFYACGVPVFVREDEKGETHVYRCADGFRLSNEDLSGGVLFAGAKGEFCAETKVIMESGYLTDLYGGGEGGAVQNVKMTLRGGLIGRYCCGGGVDDSVENVEMFALGGVVRHSIFVFGVSEQCRSAKVLYDGTLCTNFRFGSKNADAKISGKLRFTMKSGHIFDLAFGNVNQKDQITGEIFAGTVEQRISARCEAEKLHLKLYQNIFYPDGHGGAFPRLPENVKISYLPEIKRETREKRKGSDAFFYNTDGEEGKMVFRFFSLRHPEVTRDETPFSDFIGDAFLIRFPSGENMLVDTGMPYSYGEIFDGLKKMGIEKLDFLMITHPHSDHIGNAEKILSDFSVSYLLLPDHRISLPAEEEELERAVLQKAEKQGVSVRKVGRGDRISVGEGALSSEILVLNPNRSDQELSDLNGCSIACKISFQSATALLCGDITQREEEQMVLEYGKDLSCDLLKISHHGIVYQNSAPFIDACSPKKAVVQNVRDEGAFIKITSFAMEKANGFSESNLFVTGKHGKIKAILSNQGNVEITTEF